MSDGLHPAGAPGAPATPGRPGSLAASTARVHTLAFMPLGRRGQVARGANLLDAARALGVELESICGGRQTCGKCQIVVEEGHFQKHGITSSAAALSPVGDTEAAYAAA